MRKFSALVGTLLLSACGGYQPVNVAGPAPSPQALTCAREEMQERGYEVAGSTPANTVTGVQVTTQPWYKRFLGFDDTADRLTAMVSGGQLQVTGVSSDPTEASRGGPALAADGATQEVARDAQQIVAECTSGV